MTIEQKIGQMLMVGFLTQDADEICRQIEHYNFGNVILFTRNIGSAQQLRTLTSRIQEAALRANGRPAFIGIDQEGGSVRRIYRDVTAVPGQMAVAAASLSCPGAACMVGKIVGEELKDLGINLNLAPVADINDNPYNPVISIRAYGDDPTQVASLCADYADALAMKGVLPCYKHFLGHGSVDVDSHIDLPRLDKTLEQIEACELVPYKREGIEAIMTAHILSGKIDDKFPASISETILKKLLREKNGYKGLIFTDCFEMEGLIRSFSFEEAATFAVLATTDILTVSHSFGRQLAVRGALLNGVQSGTIPMYVIDAALERILAQKKKFCTPYNNKPIDFAANKRTAEQISRASVTLASGTIFEFDESTVVVGVTNYVNSIAEDTNVEKMDVAREIGESLNLPYKSIDNKNFNSADILSFCRGKKVILALADSHLTLVQKVLYASIVQNSEVLLISLRSPYDVLGQKAPSAHLCLYEYTRLSVDSLLSVLQGRKCVGALPVRLSKNTPEHGSGYVLERVLAYLQKNYNQKLTLFGVADEFYLSGGHLCKLMKKRLNKTFVDVLNEIRVSESKKLLRTSHLKVYEISTMCGFSDSNYFVKIFRKHTGVTPSCFREDFSLLD